MLAYSCKNCKQITIFGYINEFEEHFCSKECYEEYCKKNQYAIHLDRLDPITK